MSIPPAREIYLIGIGGIGMVNLAALLNEAGYDVSGSDEKLYNPAAGILEGLGIRYRSPYSASNLPPGNAPLVVGNAMSRGHVEVEEALRTGRRLFSFPEILGRNILAGRKTCVVAGTHGKTTTTACLAHLLRATNQKPGYLIGGRPLDLPTGAALGSGAAFVVEGDEYDSAFFDKRSKFLHYFPQLLVLNKIEFDHADIFPDLESILLAFRRLVNLLPDNGKLIYAGDCVNCCALAAQAPCLALSVGEGDHCDWRLLRNSSGYFVKRQSGESFELPLRIPGFHNQLNALAALAAAVSIKDSLDDYLAALSGFRGIRRRMERLHDRPELIVFDDFAHHPTAVAAAIDAVREACPDRSLIAVFEPRSNTSVRKYFQNEFVDALSAADQIVIGALHREQNIPPEQRLDIDRLIRQLVGRGREARRLANHEIVDYLISTITKTPSAYLFMSNGSFDGIPAAFVARLKSSTP